MRRKRHDSTEGREFDQLEAEALRQEQRMRQGEEAQRERWRPEYEVIDTRVSVLDGIGLRVRGCFANPNEWTPR